MQLKEIMTRDVQFAGPDESLYDIAQKMKEEDAGALPVCDGDRIRGMITDRDIVVRALAEGKDPRSSKASDVMTRSVVFCYEDDDVRDAAAIMQHKQIRRLVVLDRQKRAVGLVSIGDLALHAGKTGLAGRTLGKISLPSSSQSYYKELKKAPQRLPVKVFLAASGVVGLAALGYGVSRLKQAA